MALINDKGIARRLWGAALLLGLATSAWLVWRSYVRPASRPMVALVLPPEMESPDAPWLTRAIWDGAEQVLMGQPELHLIHAPQVGGYLKGLGAGKPQSEAIAARFGAQRVILLRGSAAGNALHLTVAVWDLREGHLPYAGVIEGSLLEPESFLRALHARLLEALSLPPTGHPSPTQFPHHPEGWKAYGQALEGLEAGDPELLEQSLIELRRSLELDPKFVPARARLAIGLGEHFVQAGWFLPGESRRKDLEAFQAAVSQAQALDPHHLQVRMLAARLNFIEQNFQAAIKQSEAVLRDDPYLVDADVTIADSYLALPGSEAHEKAKQRLEQVLALGDDRFYPNFRVAAVNLQEGDLNRALALGEKLIQGWPDRMMSYVMPSNALLWLNRPQEARQRIETGLRRFPEAKLLHRNLAYAAFQTKDAGTLEREMAFATGAWSPEQSTAIMIRGLHPAMKGDLVGTRAIYAPFLRQLENRQFMSTLDSLSASVDLYFMARTLATLGAPDKGRPYLDAAERLFPNWSQPTRVDPAFQ